MRKSIYLSWLLIFAMTTWVSSCSDDDPEIDIEPAEPELPILGAGSGYVEWTSEKGPQKHQSHRSSDNNSLTSLSQYEYLIWSCPEGISFKVMQDKTGTDPTLVNYCYNNCLTKNFNIDKVYIADPANASTSFKVKATGFNLSDGSVVLTVNNGPLPGQKNRCSENFHLTRNKARYTVICPDNVTFDIWEDVSGSDHKLYFGIKKGDIIYTAADADKLYIVNPTPTGQGSKIEHPFPVMFEPYDPSWMGGLSDSTPVSRMSIPGTHDACTFDLTGMSGCQNFNIEYQLNSGIRYFDVRPDKNGRIYHGISATNVYMNQVMDDCDKFLRDHPSEMIILQVGASSGDDITGYMNDLCKKYSRVDASTKLKTLGQYRGKIVIFRRYGLTGNTSSFGIDLTAWPNDTAGELTTKEGDKFYVQDRYYSSDEAIHDTKEKSRMVRDAIKHAGANPDIVHINFNSVTGRVVSTPWNYAWGTGSDIDPRMSESLAYNLNRFKKENPGVRNIGIIMLDYFNAHGNDDEYHLVETIINFNYQEELFPMSQLPPVLNVDNLLKNQPNWW